ncbi:Rhodanese-related sulfurtransferase [Leptolyngbya sp. PCC 7375]|nr:Rhodanese-related sulfurtransferase [Leptolyngbya sp. PCC 7375]
MDFKKPIQAIVLGFALYFCLFIGIDQSPLLATNLTEVSSISLAVAPAISGETLEADIDRFLTSMPAGYYAISNVEGLKKQLKNPQTLLVDVREPSEYRLGYILNAINIPLRTLTQNLDQIARDRPVVLYCSSGYRSAMGVMTLHLLGYDQIQGFPPSFAGWKNAGEAIS